MQRKNAIYFASILASAFLLQACGPSENSSNSTTLNEIAPDTISPKISQVFPRNGMGIQSMLVVVRGEVVDDSPLKSVVVSNETESVVAQLDGEQFSAEMNALPGGNRYTITAIDEANNETIFSDSFYFGARLSAGGAHSGILKDQAIYAWGRNNKGQAGIGFITSIRDDPASAEAPHPMAPILISAPSLSGEETKFVSLAFNQNASSALDVDGNVWSWGVGDDGQLGLGVANDGLIDEIDGTSPQQIIGVTNIVAISRGLDHALLLKGDGTVLAFGDNNAGQLGDGSTDSSDSPIIVNGLSNIVQISASIGSFALDRDGRVWAWGSNKYGQLANGVKDTDAHSIPTQIPINEPVLSLASGKGHVLALTHSGTVYAWGLNASSQVGMNETGDWGGYVYEPKLLPWFDDAIAVWAKGNQSFVQRSDGKVYPWGQNMLGTLGIEQDGNVETPNSAVFGLENVIDLGNGALHTLALNADNQFFSWGWSFEGSLGGGESTINAWTYRLPLFLSIAD
ncbi:RCC1 domain-containing protein [Reinekea sp.]|jgi:alpha-tubulin suppressor-like RCC1 family protein|uniref:RCC1 domain-containing protein n=1 Tax=Reinekea sp. TaxID=1970455 RepID=UPI00398A07F1